METIRDSAVNQPLAGASFMKLGKVTVIFFKEISIHCAEFTGQSKMEVGKINVIISLIFKYCM